MSDISLGRGIRQNLYSLQQSTDLIATTQNRLATGKKVNTAIDNPTNFFTAQSLNSRAKDLNGLLDGISNSLKTVEAADNGIRSITKLVENAQFVARQARVLTQCGTTQTLTAGADAATGAAAGARALVSQKQYDLIVLDWNLGDTTGLEVLKFIRATAENKATAVLIATGENKLSNVQSAMSAGASNYITKPYTTLN
jgi:CheY-like chemotaxis protein